MSTVLNLSPLPIRRAVPRIIPLGALVLLLLAFAACAPQAPLADRVPVISAVEAERCTLLREVLGHHHDSKFAYDRARWEVIAEGGNAMEPLSEGKRTGRNGSEVLVRARAYRCGA